MKLSLREVTIYPAHGDESPSIGATLYIGFPNKGDLLISGTIGVTFDHPAPESLTMAEIEPQAIEHALGALGLS